MQEEIKKFQISDFPAQPTAHLIEIVINCGDRRGYEGKLEVGLAD